MHLLINLLLLFLCCDVALSSIGFTRTTIDDAVLLDLAQERFSGVSLRWQHSEKNFVMLLKRLLGDDLSMHAKSTFTLLQDAGKRNDPKCCFEFFSSARQTWFDLSKTAGVVSLQQVQTEYKDTCDSLVVLAQEPSPPAQFAAPNQKHFLDAHKIFMQSKLDRCSWEEVRHGKHLMSLPNCSFDLTRAQLDNQSIASMDHSPHYECAVFPEKSTRCPRRKCKCACLIL